jgi:hypothetical protein
VKARDHVAALFTDRARGKELTNILARRRLEHRALGRLAVTLSLLAARVAMPHVGLPGADLSVLEK